MRAMSFSRVICPSGVARTTMSPNSSSVVSRPWVLIESWKVVSRWRRRRAEHAGRHLHVLFADDADDVRRGQMPRRQAIRIEPHPHAVFAAAEHLHLADTGDAPQLVAHLELREVRQVEHVVAVVRRDQVHDHQQVGRRLLGGHADALHFGRQPRQRLGDTVLHLHLGVVEVGAERERHGQRHRAVGRRLRGHVEHALDAVELLLERRRDGFGGDFGVAPGIERAHDHGRRHDFRVFADRQPGQRDGADDEDDEREHGREDRPVDEES